MEYLPTFGVNVGRYSINGACGYVIICHVDICRNVPQRISFRKTTFMFSSTTSSVATEIKSGE